MRTLLIALACLGSSSAALAMPQEAQSAWREDLAIYAQRLEASHIDLFHTLSRDVFLAELAAIEQALPHLSEGEVVARLMRLHHSVGDGHTSIPLWDSGYHRFPVDIEIVAGRALIIGTRDEDVAMLGGEILAVDGRPFDEVASRLAEYAPFVENDGSRAVRSAAYFPIAELMAAINLVDDAHHMRLEIEQGGERQELILEARPGEAYNDTLVHRLDYRLPLDPSGINASANGIGFSYFEDQRLGYIRYDFYPSASEMDRFASEVVATMRREEGRYLVIDFRDNYGGDFFIGLRLAHALNLLDGVDWNSGVFVLTSPFTFSAAMSNSAQFSDILNARRIGEPTGATPCGYQDMGQFNLPNSGLLITYSKRHFCFAEPENDALQPDHFVPVSRENWVDGQDAAMAWVFDEVERLSAAE